MADFEKLGAFYLGRPHDLAAGKTEPGVVLYDSRDLTTHAVIVGMTGSGKTGLGIGLIEEAAIDGVPVLAIDPKGDLPNLLLTFPELRPEDFEPWVSDGDARRKGLSRKDWARAQAETWRTGLSEWGQDGDRIGRLRSAAGFTVYTPGSTAGVPLSILDSFKAPPAALVDDDELLADRVATTAGSLLSLLGIGADPLRSRDHILLATLLDHGWREGRDFDLPELIHQIQRPPVARVGVLDLEAFYPEKQRFELALAVNNLLAAPGFEAWLRGEPLDIGRLLFDGAGKPQVAIVSIAHLSDTERMFFLALLLDQVVAWVRQQAGTSSLRALLYMDELFGYLPPVAEPPTKKPLLTLLKQARAHGFGLALATQNPVDLDYKALANAGTWFVGRLQTDRDKQRLLDGLEGAAAGPSGFDRRAMESTLAGLKQRVFLLHDVRQDAPTVFETRWVMSYLAGPMTREQIRRLQPVAETDAVEAKTDQVKVSLPSRSAEPAVVAQRPVSLAQAPPVLPPEVPQRFLRLAVGAEGPVRYEPGLVGFARVHYLEKKSGVTTDERISCWALLSSDSGGVDWAAAEPLAIEPGDLLEAPPVPGSFADLPAAAARARSYAAWRKSLAEHLYRRRRLESYRSRVLDESSRPGESERDFRLRVAQLARERRDAAVDELRGRHAKKAQALAERLRRAEERREREQDQVARQKYDTVVSVGATVLSALLGRRRVSMSSLGRATTAARGWGRAREQAEDVARAQADTERLASESRELEATLAAEIETLNARFDVANERLEVGALAPRKSDIEVESVALAWQPRAG